jgi:two-component system NtrC family response regulator
VKRLRILLLDADDTLRSTLRAALEGAGWDVADAASAENGLLLVGSFAPDAVLVADAGEEPAATVRALAELGSDAAIVVAAESSAVDLAIAALRAGADRHVTKPLAAPQVVVAAEKAVETRRLRRERALLREQLRGRHVLVGAAPELRLVQEVVRRAAPTKAPVLVVGETGTGRELVAQAIHEASPRRDAPFVRVSCAAMSQALLEAELFGHEAGAFGDAPGRREGRIVAADGGTLFLHEVAHLPPAVQVRLLRVLQHGELERVGGTETVRVDVRVVAASRLDLAAEVHAGRFRDDLYYRLNVVTVTLPPLRDRKSDIPALVEHLVGRSALAREKGVRGVSAGALSALFGYEWPGNVRELATIVEQAVGACAGREIAAEDLAALLHGGRGEEGTAIALIPGATLFEIEREAILRTLEEVGGSTARAAEVLGISVRKIQYRLKEYRAGEVGHRRRGVDAPVPKPVAKMAG